MSDGLLFRTAEDAYLFTGDPSYEWFSSQAEGYDVAVTEQTDDLGILAVQGPRSREPMAAATGVEDLKMDFSQYTATNGDSQCAIGCSAEHRKGSVELFGFG